MVESNLTFAEAVEDVRLELFESSIFESETNWVSSKDRIEEAKKLNDLVHTFSIAQLYPIGSGLAIPEKTLVPALGKTLSKKLKSASPEVRAGVYNAVLRSVAVGFTLMATIERENKISLRAPFLPLSEAERSWAFAVGNYRERSDIRDFIGNDALSGDIEHQGEAVMLQGLRDLGLVGPLALRVGLSGRYHAYFGYLLRMAQTDLRRSNLLHEHEDAAMEQWPLRRYAGSEFLRAACPEDPNSWSPADGLWTCFCGCGREIEVGDAGLEHFSMRGKMLRDLLVWARAYFSFDNNHSLTQVAVEYDVFPFSSGGDFEAWLADGENLLDELSSAVHLGISGDFAPASELAAGPIADWQEQGTDLEVMAGFMRQVAVGPPPLPLAGWTEQQLAELEGAGTA